MSPLRDYEFAWGFDSGVVCNIFTMDKKEQMSRSNEKSKSPAKFLKVAKKQ